MALPVTVSGIQFAPQNSYHGPFISSGGNVYFVALDGTNDDVVELLKATDPTSSFSSVDTEVIGSSSFGAFSLSVIQDGDTLHIVCQEPVNSGGSAFYLSADLSADTLSVDVDIMASAGTNGASGVAEAVDICVRSDGDIVVAAQDEREADMGSQYERIRTFTSTDGGSNWNDNGYLGSNGMGVAVDVTGPRMALGDSDTIHVVFRETGELHQQAISSADAYQTNRTIGTFTPSGTYPVGHGVSFDRSGTTKIRFPVFENDSPRPNLYSLEFDAAADPSTFSTTLVHSSAPNGVMSFAVDGSTVYALHSLASNDDLYKRNDQDSDTWSSQTQIFAGTLNYADSNIYDRSGTKLAYVMDDGGTVKYDEDSLASGVFTLTAGQGSYTLTGQSAGLLRSLILGANQGSYTFTGQAANLNVTFKLTAEQGTYTLTGQNAGLTVDYVLDASQGSYTLTGQAANLLRSLIVTAAQGAYSFTGQDAELIFSFVLVADQGGYTLTGQAADLLAGRLLSADQGSYTFTGNDAPLTLTINAGQGSYSLSGQAVNLLANRILSAVQGSYVLTGQGTGLLRDLILPANQGAYSFTGQDAALTQGVRLVADQGSYSLSGQNAVLTADRKLTADQGSYSFTGQAAALEISFVLNAEQGSYTFTGNAAGLNVTGQVAVTKRYLAQARKPGGMVR